MRRFYALLAAVLTAIAFSACGGGQEEQDAPSGTGSGVSQESTGGGGVPALSDADSEAVNRLILQCAGIITDPFNGGEEIPAYLLTRFLYERMKTDGRADGFEQSPDGRTVKVPLEIINEYAKWYFSIPEVEIDFISQQYFDGKNITIPNPERLTSEPDYELEHMTTALSNDRMRVTLELVSGGVHYQKWIYTLRAAEDGHPYIVSMEHRPVEYGLYALNNAAATLDEIIGIPVNALTLHHFEFQPLGQNILVSIASGRDLRLGILEMDTYKSNRYTDLQDVLREGQDYDIQVSGDSVCVFLQERVIVYDASLTGNGESFTYPPALLGQCDRYTTKFVLSPDRKYLAFTNASGLNYYNLQNDNSFLVTTNPNRMNNGVPDRVWEPIAFNSETGLLTAVQTENGFIRAFGILDTVQGLTRSIVVTGDSDTLYQVSDDILAIYAPLTVNNTNVPRDTTLRQALVEFNLTTYRVQTLETDFPENGTRETRDAEILLSPGGGLFRVQELPVGEDMVSSFSIRTFNRQTGRRDLLDFGYVDREARVWLKASSSTNKLVAVCDGLFIQTIAVVA